ncbi:MAG: YfhO family protein, partial [Chloroflexi bacterium]|nr:YfhO family protein [Chloroflexota bacterium]
FPLFSGLRTPVRFLLLTSFSYAILMGFCLKGIGDRLGRVHLRQFKRSNVLLAVLVLTSFIVVANTWSEARTALSTFTLSSDQEGALSYLAEQENGDYRIADSSFENEAQNPDSRYIVNPIYWTFAHGKETMPGGMPESNRYTTNLIESLRTDLAKSPLDMSEWLSLLNLKYIVVDKTNPLSSNTILGPDFERVWTSNTIDIYENHAVKPRVCSVSNTNERIIALSSAGTVNLEYAEGTQDAIVSISDEHRLSDEPTVKSVYHFTTPDDYLCLETKVDGITFDQNDAIRLVFYSEYDMPDVHLTLDVLERDGSKYDVVLGGVDGIKSGWNEVNFPISLLTLRYSTDENGHLDPGEIDRLCIGVGKQGDANEPRDFTLYFDRLSIVTQETNANVQFTKIRPGKYEVYVDSDVPSTLVLSESYNPNWVAKYDGKEVHSELVCQALNSFSIEAGKHEVTLEFVSSPLRKAGNVISVVSLGVLCAAGILVLLKRRRKRMQAATVSTEDASDGGHPR